MNIRTAAFMAAVAALVGGSGCTGARPGMKAPGFTLTSLNDQRVSLSDFKGQVVVLSYWAAT